MTTQTATLWQWLGSLTTLPASTARTARHPSSESSTPWRMGAGGATTAGDLVNPDAVCDHDDDAHNQDDYLSNDDHCDDDYHDDDDDRYMWAPHPGTDADGG